MVTHPGWGRSALAARSNSGSGFEPRRLAVGSGGATLRLRMHRTAAPPALCREPSWRRRGWRKTQLRKNVSFRRAPGKTPAQEERLLPSLVVLRADAPQEPELQHASRHGTGCPGCGHPRRCPHPAPVAHHRSQVTAPLQPTAPLGFPLRHPGRARARGAGVLRAGAVPRRRAGLPRTEPGSPALLQPGAQETRPGESAHPPNCGPDGPAGRTRRSSPCRLCYFRLSRPGICPRHGRSRRVTIYRGATCSRSSCRFSRSGAFTPSAN